jgi:eukaryotic-like serine/threonine-protein kinase
VSREVIPTSAGPTAFGKYQLFATLGRGGMADVFLAVARGPMGFNKLVVVKRLRSTPAEEASFLNMFLDEARLAARLNHPNVVHTYEVGEHDGQYFIAMEYLEGQSLHGVMRGIAQAGQIVPPSFYARIVADALAGLHHSHELKDYDGTPVNIIHRDVSPHNVFVTYDGQVKLVDFGIAKAALSRTQTEVGVLKGKVAYMAPEQALGTTIDRRADLFAMGIVFWELLTGQRLMAAESAAVTFHRLLNRPVPRVSEARPDIDPKLDDIVARALEKDPTKRYETAQEMREAIEAWMTSSGTPVRQEDVGVRIGGLFAATRADVRRQIQEHMAVLERASNTAELAALNAQAIRSRLSASGSLPAIDAGMGASASGSSSGVVKMPPGGAVQVIAAAAAAELPAPAPQPRKKRSSALTLAFVLVGLLVVAAASMQIWRWTAAKNATAPVANAAGSVGAVGADTAAPSGAPPSAGLAAAATVPSGTPQTLPPSGSVSAVSTSAPATAAGQKKPAWLAGPSVPPTTTPRSTPTTPGGPTATADPDTSAATGPGFLTLDTVPWTRVSEGGRSLGTTPILGVPLSPGPHNLQLENPGEGIKTSLSVNIKSGERTNRRMMLKQAQ